MLRMVREIAFQYLPEAPKTGQKHMSHCPTLMHKLHPNYKVEL